MKFIFREQKRRAISAFEVLVIVACILVMAAMLLSFLPRQHARDIQINCVSNLRQINLAYRIWEGDNSNLYPMAVSVTNGGAMELIQRGKLVTCLQLASNEMVTTKILVCPGDTKRTSASNWDALGSSHISYFFSADVSNDADPNLVFDGDDNVTINGISAKSGMMDVPSNSPTCWTGPRHGFSGNIGFADGNVQEESSIGLQLAFQKTGLATNRIVMP